MIPTRLVLPCALALAACSPDLSDRPWLISEPRVVAVVADAPEVRPGATVHFSVVVAAPGGTIDDAQATWSLCTDPRPLTENGPVSTLCLEDLPIGAMGPVASLQLPGTGCALFGPDTPPGNFRPRDADATGGYYQPVRVDLDSTITFGFERLRCNPAGVSNDVARDFAARYVPNQNPIIVGLTARRGQEALSFEKLPPGSEATLSLEWTPGSAEDFPVVDLDSLGLDDARETLQVSWFVTGGRLSTARTEGRAGSVTTENPWQTPDAPGSGHVWAVLRDSRGGVAVAAASFAIGP